MTEENEPACAKKTLPDGAKSYLKTWLKEYGVDAVAQMCRDICSEKAEEHGIDITRLTAEQRRKARLWGFMKRSFERTLRDALDHGPESGCK